MSEHKQYSSLGSVQQAIEALRDGRFLIIVDEQQPQSGGELIIAAEHISGSAINFMLSHGRGLMRVAMQGKMLDRLQIPMMAPAAGNARDAARGADKGNTLSVNACSGLSKEPGSGISAADRAHTIKTLINSGSTAQDISMPGHVFPQRVNDGGLLQYRGKAEAGIELAGLAGLSAATVHCEILSADGAIARLPELLTFAAAHNCCALGIDTLIDYLREHDTQPQGAATARIKREPNNLHGLITEIGSSQLPIEQGLFRATVFRDRQGLEHMAMAMGHPAAQPAPLVRLHSECLTGDAFGSLRCDCGAQLQSGLERIAEEGNGVLLYLRQEGRGIGLGNKIRAYALQETGVDTVDANEQLGFPADGRDYNIAAAMLLHMGIKAIRLLTNNPEKRKAMDAHGIPVREQLPLIIPAHPHNFDYLQTKALRMGHVLPSAGPAISKKLPE